MLFAHPSPPYVCATNIMYAYAWSMISLSACRCPRKWSANQCKTALQEFVAVAGPVPGWSHVPGFGLRLRHSGPVLPPRCTARQAGTLVDGPLPIGGLPGTCDKPRQDSDEDAQTILHDIANHLLLFFPSNSSATSFLPAFYPSGYPANIVFLTSSQAYRLVFLFHLTSKESKTVPSSASTLQIALSRGCCTRAHRTSRTHCTDIAHCPDSNRALVPVLSAAIPTSKPA